MEILRTQRLTLQTWSPADLPDAMTLWGDPKVMALLDRRGGLPQHVVEEKLHSEIERQETFGIQYWKVLEQDTGTFIGCCGLRPYNRGFRPHNSRESGTELGFHLVSTQWGRGYATEAASAVVHYAFTVLHLPKLLAGHHPQNLASKRVLTKLGFKSVGESLFEPTGLYHPDYELVDIGGGGI